MWLFLSLLTAFFQSLSDVFTKRSMARGAPPVVLAGVSRLLCLVILGGVVAWQGLPEIRPKFWTALAVSGTINAVTTYLYIHALKMADLSVTVPLLAFTPIFLLVSSPLILGESPAPMGMAGVLLIVAGSYLLHARETSKGLLAPFRALLRDKGPRWMLAVAFLWSVSSNFDKLGVLNSSPALWSFALTLFVFLAMAGLLWAQGAALAVPAARDLPDMGRVGLFLAIAVLCQTGALVTGPVPFVISLKRASIVFGVLWGHYLFREKGLRERLSGTGLMLAGVLLIALSRG
jgi:uncharacterized membrane protein